MKLRMLSFISAGLAAIILCPSQVDARYYKKTEKVLAADFTEDGKIVFVKNIKIESYPLFYDPKSWITGGPIKIFSNNTYLYEMGKNGDHENQVALVPSGNFQYSFWNGIKLAVFYFEHTATTESSDLQKTTQGFFVYDIDMSTGMNIYSKIFLRSNSNPTIGLIDNFCWSPDGESILFYSCDGKQTFEQLCPKMTINRINLKSRESSEATFDDWTMAWKSNFNKNFKFQEQSALSYAEQLAIKLRPNSESNWLFFKPSWWKK